MTAPSPDCPAVRDLLAAIRDTLNVPTPIHDADKAAAYRARDTRAQLVRVLLKGLLDGPLDYTAIQSSARVLRLTVEDIPVGYETASAA